MTDEWKALRRYIYYLCLMNTYVYLCISISILKLLCVSDWESEEKFVYLSMRMGERGETREIQVVSQYGGHIKL